MKYLLSLIFLLSVKSGIAQTDTLLINGTKFVTVKQTEKTEYEPKDTLLKIYRIESGKRKFVLTHYLFRYATDCNNEFRDHGTLTVKGDRLILKTTYWQKTGIDPIPKSRLVIYRVNEKGKLLLISDHTKN